jgi:ubiquinol-cytochrome c reductase cytochrome b/c1 subunit
LQTPEHIVPEWYFLPFYAILRAIPDKLGGVIAMVSAIAILAFIPWLDTSKVRSSKYRPLYRQFYWLLIVDFILLGYLGSQSATGIYLILGRLATLYYFLHFILVMPLIGFIEKPKPLPKSISEPVLTKEEQLAKSGQMA